MRLLGLGGGESLGEILVKLVKNGLPWLGQTLNGSWLNYERWE